MSCDGQVSILLVEDDPEFLSLLSGMLEEEGYRVITAASGEDALRVAQEGEFELVITDVKLGGIDGLDTLAHLKQGNSELQSLVITGYATEADSVRAISLGVGDYLKKPFTLPDFLRAVNRLVEEIHKERGMERYFGSVRKLTVWALEQLAVQGSKPHLTEQAREAEKAAQKQGLSAFSAFNVRLAVLVAGLSRSTVDEKLPFLFDLIPEDSLWLFDGQEAPGSSDTVEARIVQAALQGELTGMLVAPTVDGAEEEPDAALAVPQKSLNLLALARALEVSGDIEGASKVLDRLEPKARKTSLQTLLLQARLQSTRGHFGEAETLLKQADQEARDLAARSKIKLEGGLLFQDMGQLGLAREWLQTAVTGFEQLQNTADGVRARLALSALSPQDESYRPEFSEALLAPGNLELFFSSARWLYPYLLSLPADQASNRALQRITRDLPQLVCGILGQGLSQPQAMRALEIVGQVGTEGYDDLLQEIMLDSNTALRKLAQDLLAGGSPAHLAPVLRLYSLGTMATWVGEKKVPDKDWVGRKPAYILTYLAQNAGQLVSQDYLIELFWPDSPRGAKNLNQAIFVLRNLLRAPEWPDDMDYIFRNGKQIGVSPDQRVWFDAGVVRQLLDEGNRLMAAEQNSKAADLYQQALELDRGSYLEGNYEDWALSFRDSLALEMAQGLGSLAEIRLAQGRGEEALSVAQHMLEREPTDERAHKLLFQAYLDLEQPLEVVKSFERLERKMAQELSLEPSLELVKFFHLAKMKL